MRRVLLVLPTTTYRASAFLKAAKRVGVEVLTASDQPAERVPLLRDRFVEVALDDPALAATQLCATDGRSPIAAVIAVDDQGVVPAALAAERLGLVHSPPRAVMATRDKARLRAALSQAEVPQPDFAVLDATGEAGEVIARARRAVRELGYPVVVKPTSMSASQGVIRADDDAALAAAVARVLPLVRCATPFGAEPGALAQLLVERYLPGTEVALEAILRDGVLHRVALFDKPDPLVGPYFAETIYVTPSRLCPALHDEVDAVVAKAVAALGLSEGPIHAEVRLAPDATAGQGGVALIEIAARTIGGRCSSALAFASGATLEELVLRYALGETPDIALAPGASGVLMLPVPATGRLRRVEGIAKAEAIEAITGVEIAITPGSEVAALPEGDRYLGFVFARGESPEEVETALRQAKAALSVEIATEQVSR